jgi:uncharacterized protein YndB with AHSA1/START domain
MNEMKFSIDIRAAKEKVWDTLWQDEMFREWAGIIDPGTHMVGELKEGEEIQFISGNGYGVTSRVEKLTPNEYLLLRHQADTQDNGQRERDNEWTGGAETYSLEEKDGVTMLTAAFDVPSDMEDYFNDAYPKALERIKTLAESKENH